MITWWTFCYTQLVEITAIIILNRCLFQSNINCKISNNHGNLNPKSLYQYFQVTIYLYQITWHFLCKSITLIVTLSLGNIIPLMERLIEGHYKVREVTACMQSKLFYLGGWQLPIYWWQDMLLIWARSKGVWSFSIVNWHVWFTDVLKHVQYWIFKGSFRLISGASVVDLWL